MPCLFHRLLDVLAGSSQNHLRRQIQYLMAENEVLRSKISGPVQMTAQERSRLARLAKPLGSAIKVLVSIVKPETILSRIRDLDRGRPKKKAIARKPSRPRRPDDIRRLVLKIAKETGWGYTRRRNIASTPAASLGSVSSASLSFRMVPEKRAIVAPQSLRNVPCSKCRPSEQFLCGH